MLITTFRNTDMFTRIQCPQELLQTLPCGLHRASLNEAYDLMPEFSDLYDSFHCDDQSEWEIDLKIHMLMEGQYPCIPNWHCDNVPREDGKLKYDKIDLLPEFTPMYLWISGGPATEFIVDNEVIETPKTHGELAETIKSLKFNTTSMPSQEWVGIYQDTPHRGTPAQEYSWRVFARVTHKSILPQRPILSKIRRHAQVYLPHNFHW